MACCGTGCCGAKDNGNLDLAKQPLSAEEESGSPNSGLDSKVLEDDNGGVDDPSNANATSYFDRELAELKRIKTAGGVTNMKAHTFKTGAVYKGQWQDNERHGYGTQTWSDGSTFCGQWKQNVATGIGRFTHSDGDLYIGQWQKKHGRWPRSLPP